MTGPRPDSESVAELGEKNLNLQILNAHFWVIFNLFPGNLNKQKSKPKDLCLQVFIWFMELYLLAQKLIVALCDAMAYADDVEEGADFHFFQQF